MMLGQSEASLLMTQQGALSLTAVTKAQASPARATPPLVL